MPCRRCGLESPEQANFCMACGERLANRAGVLASPPTNGAYAAMFHDGSRRLQDSFDTRRLADRLEQVHCRREFNDADRAYIERRSMFFLATADADGRPDCSYKGGLPGFLRVVDERTLAFPDYQGNGMFKSLGNILANPHVGLLFIDFEQPSRLRLNGEATVHPDDPLLESYPGASLIVRVRPTQIFPNCPRYIHKMALVEHSVAVPKRGHAATPAGWSVKDQFRDVRPTGKYTRLGDLSKDE